MIKITGGASITAQGGDGRGVMGSGAAIGEKGAGGRTEGTGINPIQKPADTVVAAGGNATFGVIVTTIGNNPPANWLKSPDGGKSWPPVEQMSVGERHGIGYQWELSTDSGKSWSPVTGATKAILKLPRVTASMNGNRYRCTVTVVRGGGYLLQPEDRKPRAFIIYTTGFGRLEVRP